MDFYIRAIPAPREVVMVEVQVHGRCTHWPALTKTRLCSRRGRRLQGHARQENTRVLATRVTTSSPAVYRQVAYEYRLKQQLHPDMIIELRHQKQDWRVSECAGQPTGYIQAIGDTPFYCTFYLRQQLELFLQLSSTERCRPTLHFDATGTVLYYNLIPAQSNVPVMEFITAQHTGHGNHRVLGTTVSA